MHFASASRHSIARRLFLTTAAAALLLSSVGTSGAAAVDVGPLLEQLRRIGPKGAGHVEAIAAWQELAGADVAQLPEILAGMDGAGPRATNWIRAVVDAIAERTLRDGGKLPVGELDRLLLDLRHAPRARRTAFEWIVRVDPGAERRYIPNMLDDPCLELRRDAVAYTISRADKQLEANDKDAAAATFTRALSAARDLDQVNAIADRLTKLERAADLPRHFGFLTTWHLIAPFDNTDKGGFAPAYPPEGEIDLSAEYAGKAGTVKWFSHTTGHKLGIVDFNKAVSKQMGVVGYATTEFYTGAERDVELRLGCINANKTWLNGRLLAANEVYHAGTLMDQYVMPVRLAKGRNVILLKVCQNEQTEDWAQRWQFQLRVCDKLGTAVHPDTP